MSLGLPILLWSCMCCRHTIALTSILLLALLGFLLYGSCELPVNSSSEHPDWLWSYMCCGHTTALMSFPIMALISFSLYNPNKLPVIWLKRASRLCACIIILECELIDYSFVHLMCTTRVSIDILNDSTGEVLIWDDMNSRWITMRNTWNTKIWYVHVYGQLKW